MKDKTPKELQLREYSSLINVEEGKKQPENAKRDLQPRIELRTEEQQYYQEGQKKRRQLSFLGKRISKVSSEDQYPHYYIYSVPGLGKTHTIKETLESSGKPHFVISGSISPWAFGTQLAFINHNVPKGQEVVIVVDDCDGIFQDNQSINTMKNILEGYKNYHYQKDVSKNLGHLPPDLRTAVESHMSPNQIGFKVPTERMVFIFTSNEKLPTDDEVNSIKNKGTKVYQRKMHLNAIRSRCQVKDFDLSPLVQWGWVADVILNEDCGVSDIPNDIVRELLRFTYQNWSDLKTKSIRTFQMMLNEYRQFPSEYAEVWEMEYLK